jgi:hypothetical protein
MNTHLPLSAAHEVAAIVDFLNDSTSTLHSTCNSQEIEDVRHTLLQLRNNRPLREIASDASFSPTQRNLLARMFALRVSTATDMYNKCERDISATEQGHVLVEDGHEVSIAALEERAAALIEVISFLHVSIESDLSVKQSL